MSVKISGILKDGAGKPIPNCTIELKSKKTSLSVITQTEAHLDLDRSGSYSIDVEPCHYDVSLYIQGFPTKHVGDIHVYSDSRPGTLNDFLMMPEESDLTPEVILIFQQLRDEAKEAAESAISNAQSASADADSAATSATAAANSETNAEQSAQSASTDAESAAASAAAAAISETNAGQSAQSASEDAESAASSAIAAKSSETNAGQSAQSASTDAESAATSAAAAESSENNAKASAQSASADAENAASSATAAASSETNAEQSAQSASTDAESAAVSAAAAASSETNAKASETAAANSATSMVESVTQSAASAAAALSEANRAKDEADRAVAASDGKQDKLNISDLGKVIIVSESTEDARVSIEAAAANDARFDTINGKTGGNVKGDIIMKEARELVIESNNTSTAYAQVLFKNNQGIDTASFYQSGGTIGIAALNPNGNKIITINGTTGVTTFPTARVDFSANLNIKTDSDYQGLMWQRANATQMSSIYHAKDTSNNYAITLANGYDKSETKYYQFWSTGRAVFPGNITCVSLTQTSDKNNKENPEIIKNALDKLSKINAYTYTLKDTKEKGAGVIAQEVLEVLPEVVSTVKTTVEDERYYNDKDWMQETKEVESLAVDYSGVAALAIQSCKELYEIVKQQAKEIETLKNK